MVNPKCLRLGWNATSLYLLPTQLLPKLANISGGALWNLSRAWQARKPYICQVPRQLAKQILPRSLIVAAPRECLRSETSFDRAGLGTHLNKYKKTSHDAASSLETGKLVRIIRKLAAIMIRNPVLNARHSSVSALQSEMEADIPTATPVCTSCDESIGMSTCTLHVSRLVCGSTKWFT